MSIGVRERAMMALAHGMVVRGGADIIGAMAMGDRLGSAIWRMMAGDRSARLFSSARLELAQRIGEPVFPFNEIAGIALIEYLYPVCPVCSGRGFMVADGQPRSVCKHCGGTRRAVPSTRMRATLLGMRTRDAERWLPVFSQAHEALADADYNMAVAVRRHTRG